MEFNGKSTVKRFSPPPLHKEDPIDLLNGPPSIHTVTHIALLLHAARAEYEYWGNRVVFLAGLLKTHKASVIACKEEEVEREGHEEWERRSQYDMEARLKEEADEVDEFKAGQQLIAESEQRLELNAERQLLAEAGMISEEDDECWRRVGKTGKSVRARKSLSARQKEPRLFQEDRNGEYHVDLSTVMEVTENVLPCPPALPPSSSSLPKADEKLEPDHGKARRPSLRSLRSHRRTMNDLRGLANLSHEVVQSHTKPTRRQSLGHLHGYSHQHRPHDEHPPTKLHTQPKATSLQAPAIVPTTTPQESTLAKKHPKRQTIPPYVPRHLRHSSSHSKEPHKTMSNPSMGESQLDYLVQPPAPSEYDKAPSQSHSHVIKKPSSHFELAQALLNFDTSTRGYVNITRHVSPPLPVLSPPSSHASPATTSPSPPPSPSEHHHNSASECTEAEVYGQRAGATPRMSVYTDDSDNNGECPAPPGAGIDSGLIKDPPLTNGYRPRQERRYRQRAGHAVMS